MFAIDTTTPECRLCIATAKKRLCFYRLAIGAKVNQKREAKFFYKFSQKIFQEFEGIFGCEVEICLYLTKKKKKKKKK
jgi:hypothetical protein